MRHVAWTIIAVGLVLSAAPPLRADEKSADLALQAKGLKKVGGLYVAAGEAEVARAFAGLQKLQREHAQAVAYGRAVERGSDEGKRTIAALTQQRLQLNGQLQQARQAGSREQYNQLVDAFNEVSDRITLLREGAGDPKALQEVRERVASRREAFIGALLALRPEIDGLNARYAELAADPEVKAALDEINKAGKGRAILGPSRAFAANLKAFERVAATLLVEDIALRPDGGVNLVDVTLNGKVTRPMILDTGASQISLPAGMAAEAGLSLAADAPKVKVSVADGREFEARQGTLNSVRVGKFAVERVDCIVMPPEFANAPALLGGSFLRHFDAKIRPDAGVLHLSRVADPAAEAAPARPARAPAAKKR